MNHFTLLVRDRKSDLGGFKSDLNLFKFYLGHPRFLLNRFKSDLNGRKFGLNRFKSDLNLLKL